MTTKMTAAAPQPLHRHHNEPHTTGFPGRAIASSIRNNIHMPDSTIVDARLCSYWGYCAANSSDTTSLEDHEIRKAPVLKLTIRQRALENKGKTLRLQFSLCDLVDITEVVRDIDEGWRTVREL